MKQQFKLGFFDYNTLTVKFGGELSKPENRFVAQAIKVPPFKYTYKEREDAGGGAYYNNYITITDVIDNAYLILRDGVVIGWMLPYAACHNMKSELRPLEWKHTFKEILDFANTL